MTNKISKLLLLGCMLLGLSAKAQFSPQDIKYWVGSGTDTSYLVIDFHDGSWDPSYAWGVLHNGSISGAEMVAAVAAEDINLTVNVASSGFLEDIIYGKHEGIGGTDGNWWSTWDGATLNSMVSNFGLATTISSNEWFGLSFTDFNPALEPSTPIAAFDHTKFKAEDVQFWVGSGSDTAYLIIDFHREGVQSSFAWGYLFNNNATGENMLLDIAAADPKLTVSMGAVTITQIDYDTFSAIGDGTNKWTTWIADNIGNWDKLSELYGTLQPGTIIGASFSEPAANMRPGYPVAAQSVTGIKDSKNDFSFRLYPNPAKEMLYIELPSMRVQSLCIFDMNGRLVWEQSSDEPISIENWAPGMYRLQVKTEKGTAGQTFIKL